MIDERRSQLGVISERIAIRLLKDLKAGKLDFIGIHDVVRVISMDRDTRSASREEFETLRDMTLRHLIESV